jgi:hypothetical protein
MLRAALHLGACLSALTPCASAFAHGEPPAAYAVLAHDAQGARAVRLSKGVALRRAAQRFQFVCPSAWGDQYAAPLAALADGTIVVGATSGLMLLGEDGQLRAHPDPAAAGDSSELVRSAQGVFALRSTQAGSELLAIDAERVRVLWQDTKSLYSLAALDDKLVLLRANGLTLEQVTLAAADGKELDRQTAVLSSPVDYVFARASAGAAYALVMFRTAAVLGSLTANAFSKIAEAELSIAGPLRVGDSTLLARDGQLTQLVGAELKPLTGQDDVLCLEQNDGLSYACTPDGIVRVGAQALDAPLFLLSWLVAPDQELLPAGEARQRCNEQWQDLRVDLAALGTTLVEDASADAGGSLVDAGSAPMDAATAEDDAEAQEAEAVADGQAGTVVPVTKGNAGCQALPWQRAHAAYAGVSALVLALVRARRARPLEARRRSAVPRYRA